MRNSPEFIQEIKSGGMSAFDQKRTFALGSAIRDYLPLIIGGGSHRRQPDTPRNVVAVMAPSISLKRVI